VVLDLGGARQHGRDVGHDRLEPVAVEVVEAELVSDADTLASDDEPHRDPGLGDVGPTGGMHHGQGERPRMATVEVVEGEDTVVPVAGVVLWGALLDRLDLGGVGDQRLLRAVKYQGQMM